MAICFPPEAIAEFSMYTEPSVSKNSYEIIYFRNSGKHFKNSMTHYIILVQFQPILSNLCYGKLVRHLNELEMKEMILQNPLSITEKGRYFMQDHDRTRGESEVQIDLSRYWPLQAY